MANKLPPMMRPVETFIYKTKDTAPAICLIGRSYTRRGQSQTAKEKSEVHMPKATKFPKSLLGTLRCEVRSNSPPLISPEKREKITTATLRYPRAKEPLPGPLTALDQFTVQNGKVKRIPTSTFDFESSDHEEEPVVPYKSRINVKPDLKPIVELNRRNQELQKRLKCLTSSIESLNGAAASAPDLQRLRTTSTRASEHRVGPSVPVKADIDFVAHNRQLLYNVKSPEQIPRTDAKWMKSIRKSPMRVHAKDWTETDPVVMRRTVTGASMKRWYLSEGEEGRTRSSLVMARYPFCHSCVVHSSPIRVSLERS